MLSKEECKRLEDVIAEAELKTSGEIRLMIVKRSTVTYHVHALLWAAMVAISFLLVWYGRHELLLFARWWLWPLIVGVLFVVSGLLARFEVVQRRMTPLHSLHHGVWTRAELEFYREGLNGTAAHTGILLFISLFEKQARVLADKAIADKVPEGTWDNVLKTMLKGANGGEWEKSLAAAIREVGVYLGDHFPAPAGKQNELSNEVIIKD